MAVTRWFPAVEQLVAAWNLVMAGVWLTAASALPGAMLIGALHVAAALLAFRVGTERGGLLRDLYPALFLPAFWTELGVLHDWVPQLRYDTTVAAVDQALFGVHLNDVWVVRMPGLSELMQGAYFAYYLLAFGPVLACFALRRRAALRDAVDSLMMTYLACYLCYLIAPVDGPGHTMPRFTDGIDGGLFFRINAALHASGDSVGTAFPSSHVAGAVAMAFVALRRCARPLAWSAVALAGLIVLSTVYTQNHYPADALGGLALAFMVQLALHYRPRWSERLAPLPEPQTGDD